VRAAHSAASRWRDGIAYSWLPFSDGGGNDAGIAKAA